MASYVLWAVGHVHSNNEREALRVRHAYRRLGVRHNVCKTDSTAKVRQRRWRRRRISWQNRALDAQLANWDDARSSQQWHYMTRDRFHATTDWPFGQAAPPVPLHFAAAADDTTHYIIKRRRPRSVTHADRSSVKDSRRCRPARRGSTDPPPSGSDLFASEGDGRAVVPVGSLAEGRRSSPAGRHQTHSAITSDWATHGASSVSTLMTSSYSQVVNLTSDRRTDRSRSWGGSQVDVQWPTSLAYSCANHCPSSFRRARHSNDAPLKAYLSPIRLLHYSAAAILTPWGDIMANIPTTARHDATGGPWRLVLHSKSKMRLACRRRRLEPSNVFDTHRKQKITEQH